MLQPCFQNCCKLRHVDKQFCNKKLRAIILHPGRCNPRRSRKRQTMTEITISLKTHVLSLNYSLIKVVHHLVIAAGRVDLRDDAGLEFVHQLAQQHTVPQGILVPHTCEQINNKWKISLISRSSRSSLDRIVDQNKLLRRTRFRATFITDCSLIYSNFIPNKVNLQQTRTSYHYRPACVELSRKNALEHASIRTA